MKKEEIGLYDGYSSNVGLIKFIAAIMVILSHAFPLSSGSSDNEWMLWLTRGQYTMGGVAVAVFFFYSGLLVTKSFLKDPKAGKYFGGRSKRIVPPSFLWYFLVSLYWVPL